MKKVVLLFLCFLLLLLLCACTQSEYIDLSVLVERYNNLSTDKIAFTDFYIEGDSQSKRYYLPLDIVFLRIFGDDNNRISECRIILTKTDKTGQRLNLSADDYGAFYKQAALTVCAFTDMTETQADELLKEFGLDRKESFQKEGELTKMSGDYYYVYLSTPIESELIIYNKWLHEIESTLKPESKIPFDMTTATRNETVPLE